MMVVMMMMIIIIIVTVEAQDQAIRTDYCKNKILNEEIESKCQLCKNMKKLSTA
jgi:hypothetical protein